MRAHRNLHSLTRPDVKAWSFYADGQKRVQGSEAMTLYGVTPHHPTPTNKKFQKCLAGGARSVFAWLNAEDYRTTAGPVPPNAERVRFNPTTGAECFHIDGVRFEGAPVVYLLSDGSAWAVTR